MSVVRRCKCKCKRRDLNANENENQIIQEHQELFLEKGVLLFLRLDSNIEYKSLNNTYLNIIELLFLI